MRRLSLSDWCRYLESQFVEEGQTPAPQESPSQSETAAVQPAAEPERPPVSLTPLPPAREVAKPSPEWASAPVAAVPAREAAEPLPSTAREAYAVISIRVPDFLAFVPLLREELGLPTPEPVQASELERDAQATAGEPERGAQAAATQPQGSRAPQPVRTAEIAPRLRKRRARQTDPEALIPPEMDEIWAKLPRYLRYLSEWTDDSVTDKYYPVRGRESREELIARLTDPVLTLEEVARLLGVCPATVRRYTNRGWLRHFRTEGNQRRFRLSDVVAFLEEQMKRVPRGSRVRR